MTVGEAEGSPVRREDCVRCGESTADPVLVRIIEVGSGPGRMYYACRGPCAEYFASRRDAPAWLKEEVWGSTAATGEEWEESGR